MRASDLSSMARQINSCLISDQKQTSHTARGNRITKCARGREYEYSCIIKKKCTNIKCLCLDECYTIVHMSQPRPIYAQGF